MIIGKNKHEIAVWNVKRKWVKMMKFDEKTHAHTSRPYTLNYFARISANGWSRLLSHIHCFRYQSVAVCVCACVSLRSSLKRYAAAALRVYEVRLLTQGIKAIKNGCILDFKHLKWSRNEFIYLLNIFAFIIKFKWIFSAEIYRSNEEIIFQAKKSLPVNETKTRQSEIDHNQQTNKRIWNITILNMRAWH